MHRFVVIYALIIFLHNHLFFLNPPYDQNVQMWAVQLSTYLNINVIIFSGGIVNTGWLKEDAKTGSPFEMPLHENSIAQPEMNEIWPHALFNGIAAHLQDGGASTSLPLFLFMPHRAFEKLKPNSPLLRCSFISVGRRKRDDQALG